MLKTIIRVRDIDTNTDFDRFFDIKGNADHLTGLYLHGLQYGERKRGFVLQPICDIDPTIKHPILGWGMQMLLDCLREDDQKVLEI